MTEQITC